METVSRLPEKAGQIGARQIAKKIQKGEINTVIIAKNCPEHLIKKIGNVEIKMFDGDEQQLGTSLGKPFPVAMVGYKM